MFSCEEDVDLPSSLADDLQAVIAQQKVVELSVCFINSDCSGQGTTDFSFPGDNVVRIGTSYYNLDQMIWSWVNTSLSDPQMTLYFPRL